MTDLTGTATAISELRGSTTGDDDCEPESSQERSNAAKQALQGVRSAAPASRRSHSQHLPEDDSEVVRGDLP